MLHVKLKACHPNVAQTQTDSNIHFTQQAARPTLQSSKYNPVEAWPDRHTSPVEDSTRKAKLYAKKQNKNKATTKPIHIKQDQ